MKKIIISKLFLYRYKFIIGYILLSLAFIGMLFALPIFAQHGISEAEMESAVSSYSVSGDSFFTGDLVNMPYRALQKVSISLFGLTPYAIKLPSILIGLVLGLLLVLLLNRWFKNNVSILGSFLIILSTPFLFLAGSGTPLIMLVFWPTLLLWIGSKIQGENRPKPSYCFFFAISLLLAVFTPYMIYFALFCVGFVLLQPHLRFVIKSLPKLPLILVCLLILCGIVTFGISIAHRPDVIKELLFSSSFAIGDFFKNIHEGFGPILAWRGTAEGVFLSPLASLPIFMLALIGLFSTTKGFFASRNSIATLLLVFTVIITGFNPSAAIFFILPLSILIAHGLKYILEKWYGLFPKNPYARVAALIPLSLLFATMMLPGFFQYLYGYRYNPNVANAFTYNLPIIHKNLTDETLVVRDHYDFYKILEDSTNITVVSEVGTEKVQKIAMMSNAAAPAGYTLERIITSPMRENSDIIYLYTEKGE